MLHESGHALGFPHAGTNVAQVPYDYAGCGGFTLDPPACACEGENYTTAGIGFVLPGAGCDACPSAGPESTFDPNFFGPKYATIAECWLSRRLLPADVTFLDGDCFAFVDSAVAVCKESEGAAVTCQCPSGQLFGVSDCEDSTPGRAQRRRELRMRSRQLHAAARASRRRL